MSAGDVVGVMAAGAVGAPARYLVDAWVGDRTVSSFPWGTLAVNVSGAVLFGLLSGLVLYHAFPATAKTILGTGFCGAYTTFSTFGFETLPLLEEGAVAEAAANIAGSVAAGLLGAAGGLALAAVV